MSIRRIVCPSCGSSNFKHDAEGNLICDSCGSHYASPREEIQCRVCGTTNPPQALRCMKCGLLLGKQCPVCTHINPPGTDHCENCAEPLDTVTSIATRLYERTDEAALVRSERLVASKQSDLIYMHEQRERLQAEEQERLARLAAMRIEAQKQQRKLLIVVGVMLAVLGIGGIVLALLLASAPAP